MNLVEIKYKRTVNLGNYESCTLEMTGQISENDDADKSTVALISKVHQHLNLKTQIDVKDIDEVIDNGNIKKSDGKEVEVNEQVEVKSEEPKEEKKPVKKKATKKKAKKTSKKAEKNVPYDRENAVHKQELISILDKKYGENWNKGKNAKEIKETSGEMIGVDFLDSKGNVLDSFLETFYKKVDEKC